MVSFYNIHLKIKVKSLEWTEYLFHIFGVEFNRLEDVIFDDLFEFAIRKEILEAKVKQVISQVFEIDIIQILS